MALRLQIKVGCARAQEIERWIADTGDAEYILLIRFNKTPSPRYYQNKRELIELDHTPIEEQIAYTTKSRKKVHTLHHLARHYGAETTLLKLIEGKFEEITSDEYAKAKL